MKKTALVLGGGGFIGGHLAKRLKEDGYWVRVVDIKSEHEFWKHTDMCDFSIPIYNPLVVRRGSDIQEGFNENDLFAALGYGLIQLGKAISLPARPRTRGRTTFTLPP